MAPNGDHGLRDTPIPPKAAQGPPPPPKPTQSDPIRPKPTQCPPTPTRPSGSYDTTYINYIRYFQDARPAHITICPVSRLEVAQAQLAERDAHNVALQSDIQGQRDEMRSLREVARAQLAERDAHNVALQSDIQGQHDEIRILREVGSSLKTALAMERARGSEALREKARLIETLQIDLAVARRCAESEAAARLAEMQEQAAAKSLEAALFQITNVINKKRTLWKGERPRLLLDQLFRNTLGERSVLPDVLRHSPLERSTPMGGDKRHRCYTARSMYGSSERSMYGSRELNIDPCVQLPGWPWRSEWLYWLLLLLLVLINCVRVHFIILELLFTSFDPLPSLPPTRLSRSSRGGRRAWWGRGKPQGAGSPALWHLHQVGQWPW